MSVEASQNITGQTKYEIQCKVEQQLIKKSRGVLRNQGLDITHKKTMIKYDQIRGQKLNFSLGPFAHHFIIFEFQEVKFYTERAK